MNGIFYFSATGNSLQIAKRVQEKLGGAIKYIPRYKGDGGEFDRIILVTPIYSYGMPKHVHDFLPQLNKEKEIIVIQNYGGMVGGADYLLFKYAQGLGLNIKAIFTIKMPENFTLYFTVPKFYLNKTIRTSQKRIDKVIALIQDNKYTIPKKKRTREEKYYKNMGNWHLIGRDFKANDKCIKCQKCINLCPVGNISLVDGKIVFGDKCVACLGCYHRCPQKAIEFKNKKKSFRYINPNIDEKEIGKDL